MAGKIIVVAVGLIGSGKDVLSNYLSEKYGFHMVSFGDIVRQLAEEKYGDTGRETLQKTATEYRQARGQEFFGMMVADKVKKSDWERIVINGVRKMGDLEPIKKAFGSSVKIIWVDAKARVRFARVVSRESRRDPKTLEEFEIQEKNEARLFHFKDLFNSADFVIENNKSFQEFKEGIDRIMAEVLGE